MAKLAIEHHFLFSKRHSMDVSNLSLSTSQSLQPFLLLSKSVKGAANTKLILDALSAPGVYVFSELYQAPNVVEASSLPEVAPYYALLRIFLYGTYRDYAEQSTSLPALNDAQLKKLKHLSIVTMSENSRTLPYSVLQEYLDIPNVRELEDLIIDAFYQGLLRGKLDQREQQLQVEYAMGRDLPPERLDETINALKIWSDRTCSILSAIDARIQEINNTMTANQQERENYENQLDQVRQQIRTKGKGSGGENGAGAMDMDDDVGSNVRAGVRSSSSRRAESAEFADDAGESAEYAAERAGRAKKSRGTKRFMVGRP